MGKIMSISALITLVALPEIRKSIDFRFFNPISKYKKWSYLKKFVEKKRELFGLCDLINQQWR